MATDLCLLLVLLLEVVVHQGKEGEEEAVECLVVHGRLYLTPHPVLDTCTHLVHQGLRGEEEEEEEKEEEEEEEEEEKEKEEEEEGDLVTILNCPSLSLSVILVANCVLTGKTVTVGRRRS